MAVFRDQAPKNQSTGQTDGLIQTPADTRYDQAAGTPRLTIRQIISLLTLCSSLPAALFCLYLGIVDVRSKNDAAREHAEINAANMRLTLDGELAASVAGLTVLANSPRLGGARDADDLAEFYAEAKMFLSQRGANILLIEQDGRQVLNTLKPLGASLPKTNAPAALAQVFATGQPAVTDVFVGAVSQQALVMIGVPVIREGRVRRVLGLNLLTDDIQKLIVRAPRPEGWGIAILDSQGRFVARSRGAATGELARAGLPEAVAAHSEGWVDSVTREGVAVSNILARSQLSPWTVVVGVPRSELSSPAVWMSLVLGAAALITITMSAALAGVFGRRVVIAINRLMSAGEGDIASGIAEIDIVASRQRAMQAELRASERRFRLAMELGTTVCFSIDRNLRYTWSHSSQIGISEADHIGRTDYDLFTRESADRTTDLYRRVFLTGLGLRRDITVQSLARPLPQDFDLVLEPMRDKNGEVIGIMAAAIDITERVAASRLSEQAKAEAERAVLARSKFLAAASHDLRQPVQALALLLETLKRQVNTAATAKAVRAMETALDALSGLLASILDISRVDAGVATAHMQSIDIGGLIDRLGVEYASACGQKGLRLRCRGKPGLKIRTDMALLERVLRNLIDNAIRYTKRGGIVVGIRRRGERIRIDIVDSGIGIPADKLPHIFEEFYQVGNPGRDRSQGLGLGLSIVDRLARLIGAEVQVRSREGRGTYVTLLVPVGAAGEPAASPSMPTAVITGRRVLVIEDNDGVRMGLQLMLEGWACEVLSAESGEDALDAGERDGWRIDAIIADHRLGAGLTGTATAAEIGRRAGRSIPTLIVTGDTARERIEEVHASGFEMMHKPITPNELARKMAQLLPPGRPPER